MRIGLVWDFAGATAATRRPYTTVVKRDAKNGHHLRVDGDGNTTTQTARSEQREPYTRQSAQRRGHQLSADGQSRLYIDGGMNESAPAGWGPSRGRPPNNEAAFQPLPNKGPRFGCSWPGQGLLRRFPAKRARASGSVWRDNKNAFQAVIKSLKSRRWPFPKQACVWYPTDRHPGLARCALIQEASRTGMMAASGVVWSASYGPVERCRAQSYRGVEAAR